MNKLERFLFILESTIWIIVASGLLLVHPLLGLVVFISFIVFLLLYKYSNYLYINKLDKFINSEWELFKLKTGYARQRAFGILFILLFIALGIINDKL